ncbi:MAG: gliding motility-associated C-terminal domain-containing protein [Chitinophagales bacterium]
MRATILLFCVFVLISTRGYSQPCTNLGQTPSTAFPVCGTTVFQQTTVPICQTVNLFVPGCSGDGALYANKNPYWYKFTCYASGTLGFLITPNDLGEDYDWQLYDITGHNPDDVFTDQSLVVSGNWSGTYGLTGASASGVNFIQCASDPAGNAPTFAAMPNLIVGHTYLLMVSHWSDTQSGYALSFGGGTAVITDPNAPHLRTANADCDGKTITIKLNKGMKCSSLTGSGSEFSISPSTATVVSATGVSCSSGFDFDSLTITLTNPLPSGNYNLVINNGSDGNTLIDNCGLLIPQGEQVPFSYIIPQPTPFDSIGRPGCATDSVKIYFTKKIDCGTIAADGSDFTVAGPSPVTVVTAFGNCVNGETNTITVKFAAPIYTKGNYLLTMKQGTDGTTVIDQCGLQSPTQTMGFSTADTVSALFNYTSSLGCLSNTLTFSHNGAHDVNTWNWLFNNTTSATTPSYTISFPSLSSNTAQLTVSNGTCSDTKSTTITFNNQVKASFDMPGILCPEDPLQVTNTSTGQIDSWRWNFDMFGSSNLQTPQPFTFPVNDNVEHFIAIQLVATNNTLNCSDSARKILRLLNNCYIDVPTAFTPNGDGLNDFFSPHNALKADNLEFKVFNRWGQLIFESHSWQERWNGKFNGVPQPAAVYVWFLSYTNHDTGKKVFQKGTVMLIR